MTTPESIRLLQALVEIEDQAIAVARENGCKCKDPIPDTDRRYPIASFDYRKSYGKPYQEIAWRIVHEPDCPMDGQRGVGYARDPKCGNLSPETQVPCYLNQGHSGAHEGWRGPSAISSWATTSEGGNHASQGRDA